QDGGSREWVAVLLVWLSVLASGLSEDRTSLAKTAERPAMLARHAAARVVFAASCHPGSLFDEPRRAAPCARRRAPPLRRDRAARGRRGAGHALRLREQPPRPRAGRQRRARSRALERARSSRQRAALALSAATLRGRRAPRAHRQVPRDREAARREARDRRR